MKVAFIHEKTGFYVGGSVHSESYCKKKMIEAGMSEERAEALSGVLGPYVCVWVIEDNEDPYESMRSRLGDIASCLDGEDIVMEECDHDDFDAEEEDEDGEID